MADLRYTIDVNTADATRGINTLKTALGGLAAAFSLRQIVKFADDITNLRNKLLTPIRVIPTKERGKSDF